MGGLARVAAQAVAGTVIAGLLAFGTAGLVGRAIEPDPSKLALVADGVIVAGVFGVAYAGVSLVLRIPELASIVEVMVDLVRRPLRS